jgi:hypothetical protein
MTSIASPGPQTASTRACDLATLASSLTDALELLRQNSAAAAAAVRAFSDEQLAQAAPVSLYADAPLTCQFYIEDHALRHSYHHLAKIRAALGAQKG